MPGGLDAAMQDKGLLGAGVNLSGKQDFTSGAPTMSVPGDLAQLPITRLISEPLQAAIDAQLAASRNTVNFIKNVCFEKDQPKMIEFKYQKTSAIGMPINMKLRIPLLTMIPIPNLRLEEVYVGFLFKVTTNSNQTTSRDNIAMSDSKEFIQPGEDSDKAVQTSNTNGTFTDTTRTELATFNCVAVNKTQNSTGITSTKEFSYEVKIRAVADHTPLGMEKILEVLTSSVREVAQATANQSATELLGGMASNNTAAMSL